MHKIRTLFLSRNITSLAQWRGLPRLRALLHRSAIKLDFSISHDRNSVLILCIIVVAVFFGQGSTCTFFQGLHMLKECCQTTHSCHIANLSTLLRLFFSLSLFRVLAGHQLTTISSTVFSGLDKLAELWVLRWKSTNKSSGTCGRNCYKQHMAHQHNNYVRLCRTKKKKGMSLMWRYVYSSFIWSTTDICGVVFSRNCDIHAQGASRKAFTAHRTNWSRLVILRRFTPGTKFTCVTKNTTRNWRR